MLLVIIFVNPVVGETRPRGLQASPASPKNVEASVQAQEGAAEEWEEEEEDIDENPAVVKSQPNTVPSISQPEANPVVVTTDNSDTGTEPDDDASEPAKDVENPEARQKMLERLVRKFTLPNGKMARIVFLRPINYVTPAVSDIVLATMHKAFSRYGDFNIVVKDTKLDSLTLEGFRSVVGRVKADVIFVTVLKPTHFDLFVFDRRSPYFVFYHSEVHPEEKSRPVGITEELVVDQTRVLLRRGLYLYLTNQYYELPRAGREVVMESQIPRWMASTEMVESVNSTMNRRFYSAASIGGSLTATSDSRSWAGGLFGFQVGVRPYGAFHVEVAYEVFAYNLLLATVRYNVSNKYSSFQIMPGLGAAYLTQRKAIEIDRNLTLHKNHYYLAPSVVAVMPLGDLYFKIESQLLVALTGDRFALNFLPGLMFQF